jgi:hypothetical protein
MGPREGKEKPFEFHCRFLSAEKGKSGKEKTKLFVSFQKFQPSRALGCHQDYDSVFLWRE